MTDPMNAAHLRALLSEAADGPVTGEFEAVYRRAHRQRLLRRSGFLAVTVVLAGAAVVVPSVLFSGNGHPHGSAPPATRTPSSAVDLTGAIPWIGTPSSPYQALPALPNHAPATDARACTAQDVSATFDGGNGAGGHTITYVRLRNTSRTTCVLKGYPAVAATQPGLPKVAGTNGSFFPNLATANMAPKHDTLLGLETDTYCAARPSGGPAGPLYYHVVIGLPGGGTITLGHAALDVSCGLHVTKFWVNQPQAAQLHDPLSDLQVSLEVPATVRAGARLTYVADLTNPTDQAISLDRCPSYLQAAHSGEPTAVSVKQSYALNCPPVGAIAAHGTVRFEMRMELPATSAAGALTMLWTLIGPDLDQATATVQVLS